MREGYHTWKDNVFQRMSAVIPCLHRLRSSSKKKRTSRSLLRQVLKTVIPFDTVIKIQKKRTFRFWDLFGYPFGYPLGTLFGPFWALLGPLGTLLGLLWSPFGPLGGHLEPSWASLEPSGVPLGLFLSVLVTFLCFSSDLSNFCVNIC